MSELIVKRYDLTLIGKGMDSYVDLREDPQGDWVSYEDYEKLARELEELEEFAKRFSS